MALLGELDPVTAPTLSERLDQLIADGHRDLRVNLSALTFLEGSRDRRSLRLPS